MIVLGIETSCDETAAAIVTDQREILSNEVFSQIEEHRPYGGVVPEVAARAHLERIDSIIDAAMKQANVTYSELDGIAVTAGPGLIGGVLVGVMTGKAISVAHDIPFLGINHLEGHALTARLSGDENGNEIAFPYLLLLVSGGHCQILIVSGPGKYKRLGTTIDDALGEAFDKTAKMLGLGYPGGPEVERWALKGDPKRFDLPRPLKGRSGCDFSFSGLKTKVRQTIEKLPEGKMQEQDIADICASFQAAAGDVLVDRCQHALIKFRDLHPDGGPLVVAGGVAANKALRANLTELAIRDGTTLIAPPIHLCTDNAAMIAWAGVEQLKSGATPNGLDFKPRPRWPLDPDAPLATGTGIKQTR